MLLLRKCYGSVLEEKSFVKMLGLSFCSKFDWGFYIVSTTKTTSKITGALICSVKFIFLVVAFLVISINLPHNLVWNTVLVSELRLLAATWMLDKLKKWDVELLVLHLLFLSNHLLIFKM